ncbi:MAG: hypothetical protein WBG50_25605 [Desulfomonilaceae bacterium]
MAGKKPDSDFRLLLESVRVVLRKILAWLKSVGLVFPEGYNLQNWIVMIGFLVISSIVVRKLKLLTSVIDVLDWPYHMAAIPVLFFIFMIAPVLFRVSGASIRFLFATMCWLWFLILLDVYFKCGLDLKLESVLLYFFVYSLLVFALFNPELPMLSACLVSVAVAYQFIREAHRRPLNNNSLSPSEAVLGFILLSAPLWMEIYIALNKTRPTDSISGGGRKQQASEKAQETNSKQ